MATVAFLFLVSCFLLQTARAQIPVVFVIGDNNLASVVRVGMMVVHNYGIVFRFRRSSSSSICCCGKACFSAYGTIISSCSNKSGCHHNHKLAYCVASNHFCSFSKTNERRCVCKQFP